jgi:hypothetical protein
MKKALLLLIFLSSGCFAAPVGNPLNPAVIKQGFFISQGSWINIRAGYEGNFVYDSKMKETLPQHNHIDNFKQDVNSATLTFNIHNRFDLYALAGEERIRSDWRFNDTTAHRIELESHFHFSWGSGAKVILFEWGKVALSAGGRYSQTKPKLLWLTDNGVEQFLSKESIKYSEWQTDLGFSYRIDMLIPYLGAKYSSSKFSIEETSVLLENNSTSIHMKNRNNFGVYLGCSLSNSKYFMLQIEARLLDEEAVTVSGDVRF